MRKIKIAIMLLIVVLALIAFTNVSNAVKIAARTITIDETAGTTETTGTKVEVTKEIKDVVNSVTGTFTYHIEQVPADTTTDPNSKASATNLPSDFTITFDKAKPATGSTTVSKTVDLDMSGINFSEVGNYKFKITETNTSNHDTFPIDDRHEYYVYVSVRWEVDSNNVPTDDMYAVLANQSKDSDAGDKKDVVFDVDLQTTEIRVKNDVTGNLADKEKYFKYEILFTNGVEEGDKLTLTGGKKNPNANALSEELTVDSNKKVTFYAKHGDTAIVSGMHVETKYKVSLIDEDNYKTYIDESTITDATATKTTSAEKETVKLPDQTKPAEVAAFEAGNITRFVNNKEADVLTGIFYNYGPFIILVVLALIGIVIIKKTSK